VIEVSHVTKHYGEKLAVDDLSFTVPPGVVTGFLGPNGAGKSTTMRMILGLDAPTSGTTTVNGKSYRDLRAPMHEIGAMLEARSIHTGRSAYNHLLAMAQTHGLPRSRVEEVIEVVGLSSVARKRAGGFSLGMGQRLGIASALLGDPATVILDEPANGLDPEGILWIRNLLKGLATDGRTVFLSSHLMSEIALTAEHLARASADAPVRVRCSQPSSLRDAILAEGGSTQGEIADALEVHGLRSERIGELASHGRIVLYELTPQTVSLEDAFMRLTGDSVEYHATALTPSGAPALEPAA
jgi:ABC-2 type transport system ATP-binding protein